MNRSIKALRQFAYVQSTFDDLADLGTVDQLDRISGIIQVTHLEDRLIVALSRHMRSLSQSDHDFLFRGDAPFASFSAKIRLGYALSIFGRSTRNDLDTIREIRNAFAHSTRPLDFSRPVVAACCNLLRACERHPVLQPADPKFRFGATCAVIYGALGIVEEVTKARSIRRRKSLNILVTQGIVKLSRFGRDEVQRARLHAPAVALRHCAAASDRKIRRVERETRCR